MLGLRSGLLLTVRVMVSVALQNRGYREKARVHLTASGALPLGLKVNERVKRVEKGKMLQSERVVNSILITILRF